jgi:serine/threonine-protein kinase CTR1
VNYNDLKFVKLLGKGSQGEVHLATLKGLDVAVKKVDARKVSSDIIEEFCSEAEIMRQLRHPNLTLFMGVSLEDPHLCIVTELVHRGSLFDIIHDEVAGPQMTWKKCLTIAHDVAQGMAYLHSADPIILHRDLKSLNILVNNAFEHRVFCSSSPHFYKMNTNINAQKHTPPHSG